MTDTTVNDTPHTMLGDFARQRDLITSLDLQGCNVAYIVMGLNEYELEQLAAGKIGHGTGTWPVGIQARMETEIARWLKENNGKSVKAFTQGVHGGTCTMAIHWRPKP